MERKKTTSEVAALLGMPMSSLHTFLVRHPALRPVEQLPSGDLLWSVGEIEAVREYRSVKRKTGPKPKQRPTGN